MYADSDAVSQESNLQFKTRFNLQFRPCIIVVSLIRRIDNLRHVAQRAGQRTWTSTGKVFITNAHEYIRTRARATNYINFHAFEAEHARRERAVYSELISATLFLSPFLHPTAHRYSNEYCSRVGARLYIKKHGDSFSRRPNKLYPTP